jgi:hypothetical protein
MLDEKASKNIALIDSCNTLGEQSIDDAASL